MIDLVITFPGVTLDYLQSDPFLETSFLTQFRAGMAWSAGVTSANIVVTALQQGSIILSTTVVFPSLADTVMVNAYIQRVNSAPTNVAWMFTGGGASNLSTAYGMPYVSQLNLNARTTAFVSGCPLRPDFIVYSPSYVSMYQFWILVAFNSAYNVSTTTCGTNYR